MKKTSKLAITFFLLCFAMAVSCQKEQTSPTKIDKEYEYHCAYNYGGTDIIKDTLTDVEGVIVKKKYYFSGTDTTHYKYVYLIDTNNKIYFDDLAPTIDLPEEYEQEGLVVKVSGIRKLCLLQDLVEKESRVEKPNTAVSCYFSGPHLGQKFQLTNIKKK